jgi:hypothetical protein
MAKPMETMKATLIKNTSKGGAWLLNYQFILDGTVRHDTTQAWANPSAAKRALKEIVLRETPRKSIKMVANRQDENDKPISFIGEINYRPLN